MLSECRDAVIEAAYTLKSAKWSKNSKTNIDKNGFYKLIIRVNEYEKSFKLLFIVFDSILQKVAQELVKNGLLLPLLRLQTHMLYLL